MNKRPDWEHDLSASPHPTRGFSKELKSEISEKLRTSESRGRKIFDWLGGAVALLLCIVVVWSVVDFGGGEETTGPNSENKLGLIGQNGDNQIKQVYRFEDIKEHWAKDSIERLAEMDIITGFPDGTFRPEDSVTREHVMKMLIGVTGEDLVRENATFTDVPDSHWANPYIEAAVISQIILPKEYGDHFGPFHIVSRQEMTMYISRVLSLEPATSELSFNDREMIENQAGMVGAAVESGIMIGFGDNTFRPAESLTRAQAAIVMTRIIDYITERSQ